MKSARNPGLPFILITVFLDMLGIGIVIPILPALVGEFTVNREWQSYWYGTLLAGYGLSQFLCAPLVGALSDRFGRRPVLLASIFGLGFNFLLTAFAPSLLVLLVARLIGGATGASFTVAGAYIADITTPESRSRSFGILGSVFGLGFICGPMLGGLLGQQNLRLPYLVAACLSLTNWLYGYFILPESLPSERRTPFAFKKTNPFAAIVRLSRLQGIGGLVWVYSLTVLAQFVLQSTWVLYTSFRFGWGPRENGFSLFVVGLASTLSQAVLLRVLLKMLDERQLALLGMISSCVAYVCYGLATQGWMMYLIIAANLLGFTIGPALQGIVSKAAGPKNQGVTLGSLNSISSLSGVVAPLLGNFLLAFVGHLPRTNPRVGLPFFLGAALQLSAWFLAIRHFRQLRAPSEVSVPEPS
jgi:MFS transporter, DHA1 family, tetracycline resistance protein